MTPTLTPSLNDALQHHKAGDLAKAAPLYRAILQADPRHADAYHLLGVLMHQLQQSQVAAELIGCAIEINGAFAPYHNNLGNALLALGNTEQARACFQRSIALHCSADGYINLATLELGDGRSSEARAAFKAALRLDPKRVEGLVGLGRLALMDSQTSPAKRWLEKALAIAPCCISALTLLGDTHLQQERFSEAEKYYARATECSPSDTEAHLKMGHLKMRLQHYASAAECYAKAHLLNPENHRVAILLGSAHLMNDDPGAAADAFTRALQIDDRHAESHHLLGSALTLRRDYEQALVSFERALSLDPELHEVRNGMGNAYSGRGDYPRAASAFEAALALQSRNPTYLMNVGINLGRQGNRRAIAVCSMRQSHLRRTTPVFMSRLPRPSCHLATTKEVLPSTSGAGVVPRSANYTASSTDPYGTGRHLLARPFFFTRNKGWATQFSLSVLSHR